MYKTEAWIEAASRCCQPAFALGDGIGVVQQAVGRVYCMSRSAGERRMPGAEAQPVSGNTIHVLAREQYWNISPCFPVLHGCTRFNAPDHIKVICIAQPIPKFCYAVCNRHILHLFANQNFLSEQFR